jgi:BirA family transcriptional regulator, biotin operon repressor / biotin---[acetyl-CoA-carboxylase] ligase
MSGSGPLGAWPAGYDRVVLDAVDSTNAEALRRAPGLAGPVWILARRQTAGRGRRGRDWSDPPGNFAATLAVRLPDPPARLALRSFVAALALHDALQSLTDLGAALALKWPNDVLLNSGKLSGILLESGGQGVLALGIGVNLRHAPPADPAAAHPPVALRAETGFDIGPEALLDHLAPAYAVWEERMQIWGFAPLRQAFLSRAARLGDTITARTQTEAVTGRFETIDDTGALVLTTPQGLRTIPAADIYF